MRRPALRCCATMVRDHGPMRARTTTRCSSLGLAALVLLACADALHGPAPASGGRCDSAATVVKLGRLVDPLDGSVLVGALVVVVGERITHVGTDPAAVPCGAAVVDWSA